MNHDITVERFGVRLRPVCLADAEFIVRLRNSPSATGFIGDSATDVKSQEAWLGKHLGKDNDYYFIVERSRDGEPVGTTSVYDVKEGIGEWGRVVIMPGVKAFPASAWLCLSVGFDALGLQAIRITAVEYNQKVLSIMEGLGAIRLGVTGMPQVIQGQAVNVVEFRIPKADWPRVSAYLEKLARRAEKGL